MASSAVLAAVLTTTAHAQGVNTIEELVVTAEKREQSLQDVPVAVSAFTSEGRDLIGITSVQDITNFTPGLQYSSQTDRVSLRGVGRTSNVHSADASVSVYSDGIYTTSTVEAGKTPLFLERTEILRGPQSTLYGRNAVAGAINLVSKRPTEEWYAEARAQYQNYDHSLLEFAASGPTKIPGVYFRVAANWEKQRKGWIDNIVPGMPDEGNVIDTNIVEGQLKFDFNENFEGWAKLTWIEWRNGGGGPGARATWTPAPYPTTEALFSTAITLNPGYGCNPNTTNVVNPSPMGCTNPALTNPRKIASTIPYDVDLNGTYIFASEWTYHFPSFDLRYLTGAVNYNYALNGPTPVDHTAPITSYRLPSLIPGGNITVNPTYAFNYQERENWWSNELTLISTHEGPLQWLAGLYYWDENYTQPVYTYLPNEPRVEGPFGVPAVLCAQRAGVCPPNPNRRIFDTAPEFDITSKAAYGQIDWQFAETFTFTAGLRYSVDHKEGVERGRLLCYLVAGCFAAPELNGAVPGGIPVVDITENQWSSRPVLPEGVDGPTTFDRATGYAMRKLSDTWKEATGNVGVKWEPDADTNAYARYSHGYKPGGYRIGIDVGFSPNPRTEKETVDAFEVGMKKTFGGNLQTNLAAFWYDYKNAQIPLSVINTSGAVAVSEAILYNVPEATSKGIELESIWQPIDNLQILFNYSYLDAEITEGTAVDPADPAALNARARPITDRSTCRATVYGDATTTCAADVYTSPRPVVNAAGQTTQISANPDPNGGFQRVQDLDGNSLPNAPRHKIAINANYTYDLPTGGAIVGSVSYIWRDAQYGSIFNRDYYKSPSWDQWDARVTWQAPDNKVTVIAFIRNIFDDLGYEGGAGGVRRAGSVYTPPAGAPIVNSVQGVYSTYPLTAPRTYGVELQYRFF
ncbi:TonB-dependent receptor [Phenylobacterium sp. J367]|uniref:TonB-dependent receptor n=1 Tax=Phenylobacterium sp. J367 TaxID=2898435 RepID=UPI0021518F24|nr:TonB-dependent receptor [Phenylobacterium sp. J367]MCR5879896.1 TonB-dependent receptor [Phenylobacterium sp. J367]